ncbi:MAG: hypothetical protein ACI9OU_000921 [Candidatus Promineifilaceae bacterium]|jgi:hypothetical protein
MKNKENGMIDLSGPTDPNLLKKPFFFEPIPLAAWIWIIGGVVTIATTLFLWLLRKS